MSFVNTFVNTVVSRHVDVSEKRVALRARVNHGDSTLFTDARPVVRRASTGCPSVNRASTHDAARAIESIALHYPYGKIPTSRQCSPQSEGP